MSTEPFIVSLDIGSSSVRALLFDSQARQMEGYGTHSEYRIDATPDGGAEADPDQMAQRAIDCLNELHQQVQKSGLKVAAVAGSAFWHSFLGVDGEGHPTLPLLHLLDTRSASEVSKVPNAHTRTGCVPHSSYWPAKLLWLAKNRADGFRATKKWLSLPEYLFQKIFDRTAVSTSMLSGTGLWDQNAGDCDSETLNALPIHRDQLPDTTTLDQPICGLKPEYQQKWPAFKDAHWYPALGDGACSNLGSGCSTRDRAGLMVGTTGAMRVVIQTPRIEIAKDLWCYRVDQERFVVGGALSNGGDVFAWMKRNLVLPEDIEAKLKSATPGSHRLTVLPFLSGERTPYWRADLRAAITGISLSTEPFDILRAALESVALRFREIYNLICERWGEPKEVVASGGALLHSPGWTQMIADALGRPVITSTEPEPSSRGAALWVLEQLGAIRDLSQIPASIGATIEPRTQFAAAYEQLFSQQHDLYERLFG